MDSRWLWVILILIIVALGGWYLFGGTTPAQAPSVTEQPATTTPATEPAAGAMVPAPVTVTYTDQGFSPKSVTVTEGQTVTWVNQSSGKMWVASGVHPTHSVYDGTSKDAHCAASYTGATPFDECTAADAGASYSFTFTKAGDWQYHNHASASNTGDVVVTAAAAAPGDKGGVSASTSVNVL